jgi:hypothetical protein
MKLVDNGTQAATLPALPAPSGTPGFFTNGVPGVTPPTRVDAADLNAMQGEIASVITGLGASLDRTNNAQMAGLINPRLLAIAGAASTTGPVVTTNKRFVAASSIGLATGENSAVIASEGDDLVSVGALGRNSAAIASLKDDPSVAVGIAGQQTAALACENVDIASGLRNTAAVACQGSHLQGSGILKATVASLRATVSGPGSRGLIAASSDVELHGGANVALLGSVNARLGLRTNGVALGWAATAPAAGTDDANLTIWLDSEFGSGNATAWNTSGADFAEWFQCAEPIAAGTPVTLDGEIVRPAGPDDWLLGVVSDSAGIVGNQAGIDPRGAGWCIVGLVGQIRVRLPLDAQGREYAAGAVLWRSTGGATVRVMAASSGDDGRRLCFVR